MIFSSLFAIIYFLAEIEKNCLFPGYLTGFVKIKFKEIFTKTP